MENFKVVQAPGYELDLKTGKVTSSKGKDIAIKNGKVRLTLLNGKRKIFNIEDLYPNIEETSNKTELLTKKTNKMTTEKKAAEKKTPAKKTEKKVGVIASILEVIQKSEKPSTFESILQELKKRFPERAEKSMLTTIKVQIGGKKQPTRLEKEKKVKLFINNIEGVKYFSV